MSSAVAAMKEVTISSMMKSPEKLVRIARAQCTDGG